MQRSSQRLLNVEQMFSSQLIKFMLCLMHCTQASQPLHRPGVEQEAACVQVMARRWGWVVCWRPLHDPRSGLSLFWCHHWCRTRHLQLVQSHWSVKLRWRNIQVWLLFLEIFVHFLCSKGILQLCFWWSENASPTFSANGWINSFWLCQEDSVCKCKPIWKLS